MKIEHDVEKIYLTMERNEILVHIPFRIIFEELESRTNGKSGSMHLTKREEQVIRGILEGKGNKEIASDLNVVERTVKYHVSNLLAKNKVDSRLDLQMLYANAGGERQ